MDKEIIKSFFGDNEIKFENLKMPLAVRKDFLQRTSTHLIINAGSDNVFFPNKTAPFLFTSWSLISSVLIIISMFHPKEEQIYFLAIFFLITIIICVWWAKTDIKTEFNISSAGIDVHSRVGSLFIPKENIKDIYIIEKEQIVNRVKSTYLNTVIEFKSPVHIPYTREYVEKIDFLNNYRFINEYQKITYYIVQEMRKMFDLNN